MSGDVTQPEESAKKPQSEGAISGGDQPSSPEQTVSDPQNSDSESENSQVTNILRLPAAPEQESARAADTSMPEKYPPAPPEMPAGGGNYTLDTEPKPDIPEPAKTGSAASDVATVSTRDLIQELLGESRAVPVFAGDTGNLQGIRFYMPDQTEPITINRPLITIGRKDPVNNVNPTLDLSPYHGRELGVSRYHAEIAFSNDTYYLKDMGSTNGTWINNRKVPPYQQLSLYPGDQLRFGHLVIVVRFAQR